MLVTSLLPCLLGHNRSHLTDAGTLPLTSFWLYSSFILIALTLAGMMPGCRLCSKLVHVDHGWNASTTSPSGRLSGCRS